MIVRDTRFRTRHRQINQHGVVAFSWSFPNKPPGPFTSPPSIIDTRHGDGLRIVPQRTARKFISKPQINICGQLYVQIVFHRKGYGNTIINNSLALDVAHHKLHIRSVEPTAHINHRMCRNTFIPQGTSGGFGRWGAQIGITVGKEQQSDKILVIFCLCNNR